MRIVLPVTDESVIVEGLRGLMEARVTFSSNLGFFGNQEHQ